MCKYQIFALGIEHHKRQLMRWRYLYTITSDTQLKNRVQKVIDKCDSDIKRLESVRLEIEKTIQLIPKDQERELLKLRYIDGLGWDEIAEQLYYSSRNVYRLHRKALELIGAVLKL